MANPPPGLPTTQEEKEKEISGAVATIKNEEVVIVILVLAVWAGLILLFFKKWGKIRMLEPYQPEYRRKGSTASARTTWTRLDSVRGSLTFAECPPTFHHTVAPLRRGDRRRPPRPLRQMSDFTCVSSQCKRPLDGSGSSDSKIPLRKVRSAEDMLSEPTRSEEEPVVHVQVVQDDAPDEGTKL